MADTDKPTAERELQFIEALYGDPIREKASGAARHLVIGALLLLAVARYGAQVQSTSSFPITFSDPHVLPTVLSILVMVLAANFVSLVAPDLLRYREVDLQIDRFVQEQSVADARSAAQEMDEDFARHEENEGPDPDPWWEDFHQIREHAAQAMKRREERLGKRRLPKFIRFVRVAGEFLTPLLLAGWALWEAQPLIEWTRG